MRNALFILLCLLSFPCLSQAQDDSTLLEEMRQKAQNITAISSSFTQEKHLAIFNDVVVSKGTFVFARPEKLRWEYVHPFRSGFVLNGDGGKRWDDITGNHEVDLKSDPVMRVVAEQVLAWTTFDLEMLRSQYDIQVTGKAPIALKLTPQSSGLAATISHLRIVFAEDATTISVVELHDQDGDFTKLSFHDTILNPEIPEGVF